MTIQNLSDDQRSYGSIDHYDYSPELDMIMLTANNSQGNGNSNNHYAVYSGKHNTFNIRRNQTVGMVCLLKWVKDKFIISFLNEINSSHHHEFLYSLDGINLVQAPNIKYAFYDIIYIDKWGLYVGLSDSGIPLTSPDGLVWTQPTTFPYTVTTRKMVWCESLNTLYGISGSSYATSSQDGTTWSYDQYTFPFRINGIAYSEKKGIFLAQTTSDNYHSINSIYSSTNLVDWNLLYGPYQCSVNGNGNMQNFTYHIEWIDDLDLFVGRADYNHILNLLFFVSDGSSVDFVTCSQGYKEIIYNYKYTTYNKNHDRFLYIKPEKRFLVGGAEYDMSESTINSRYKGQSIAYTNRLV